MQVSSASISSRSFNAPAGLHARPVLRPRPVTFHAPGTAIYGQGEQAGVLYKIKYGAVRIYRLLADGRRQVVAFHIKGETFGFEAWKVRSFYAEAIAPTGLTTVDAESDGRYSADLMALALRSMVRAQEHLLVIGRQSALEKLAVFLVDLDDRQGHDGVIDLPMTRTDIGDYLGMTIETVSRSFSKLRDMGVLQLRNTRCVEILKGDKLRAISA
jgi:CRP/FNR family nitrogen fixation transcriptional regulator